MQKGRIITSAGISTYQGLLVICSELGRLEWKPGDFSAICARTVNTSIGKRSLIQELRIGAQTSIGLVLPNAVPVGMTLGRNQPSEFRFLRVPRSLRPMISDVTLSERGQLYVRAPFRSTKGLLGHFKRLNKILLRDILPNASHFPIIKRKLVKQEFYPSSSREKLIRNACEWVHRFSKKGWTPTHLDLRHFWKWDKRDPSIDFEGVVDWSGNPVISVTVLMIVSKRRKGFRTTRGDSKVLAATIGRRLRKLGFSEQSFRHCRFGKQSMCFYNLNIPHKDTLGIVSTLMNATGV